jgi:siroheme synthase
LEKLAGEARKQEFEPPAIVVIGDIVTMRERLVAEHTPANKDAK